MCAEATSCSWPHVAVTKSVNGALALVLFERGKWGIVVISMSWVISFWFDRGTKASKVPVLLPYLSSWAAAEGRGRSRRALGPQPQAPETGKGASCLAGQNPTPTQKCVRAVLWLSCS